MFVDGKRFWERPGLAVGWRRWSMLQHNEKYVGDATDWNFSKKSFHKFFMADALISKLNTPTIHIKSTINVQQHRHFSFKTLYPVGIRTRVFRSWGGRNVHCVTLAIGTSFSNFDSGMKWGKCQATVMYICTYVQWVTLACYTYIHMCKAIY
jgi:hypothetical protein